MMRPRGNPDCHTIVSARSELGESGHGSAVQHEIAEHARRSNDTEILIFDVFECGGTIDDTVRDPLIEGRHKAHRDGAKGLVVFVVGRVLNYKDRIVGSYDLRRAYQHLIELPRA